MASGDDITEAGYFVRPCEESKGRVVRSLRTRKLVVTRDVYVVKVANTRHAQLALSGDLVARHGSLDTAPDDYRDSVRKLVASRLDLPVSSALVIDDPFSGVPVALVPALDADHAHVLVPETAWFADGHGPLPVLADVVRCPVFSDARGRDDLPRVFTPALHTCTVCVMPAGLQTQCIPDDVCAAIGVPSGALLPSLVSHDLRHLGCACAYAYEGRHPDGLEFRVLVIYVLEVAVCGETTRSALERLFHAHFLVFSAYATSGGSAPLLRPFGPQPRRHTARRGFAPR
mmetsp:Transcript_15831/g.36735  ORF Transcript_15831/g.36735 Transcript_15831/m.36735 type:complete len:287 (+) Transcript_15831:98-958(+)